MKRRAILAILAILALGGCARKPEPAAAPPPPPPATRLVLGGDVMLSRYVGRLARRQKDPAAPFRAIAPFLSAADIAFVNLESPFSDVPSMMEYKVGTVFLTERGLLNGQQ